MEEIEEHGKQVVFRSSTHKTKKDYNRKALKREMQTILDKDDD